MEGVRSTMESAVSATESSNSISRIHMAFLAGASGTSLREEDELGYCGPAYELIWISNETMGYESLSTVIMLFQRSPWLGFYFGEAPVLKVL
jgi:hypothetical protein